MLSVRDRLSAFPVVAAPALSAFLLGRLLAAAGSAMQETITRRGSGQPPLAEWTTRFLDLATASESHAATIQTFGNWSAVAISVIGFLIVHRLGPERAFRVLITHLSISWGVQVVVFFLAVLAMINCLAPHS